MTKNEESSNVERDPVHFKSVQSCDNTANLAH